MEHPRHVAIDVSRDEHYKSPYLQGLKEQWPSLARDFRHYCHNEHPETGEMWVWTSPEGQKFFHLILDEVEGDRHRDESRLQSFKKALKKVKKEVSENTIDQLEFPKGAFHFTKEEMNQAQVLAEELFVESKLKIIFS